MFMLYIHWSSSKASGDVDSCEQLCEQDCREIWATIFFILISDTKYMYTWHAAYITN